MSSSSTTPTSTVSIQLSSLEQIPSRLTDSSPALEWNDSHPLRNPFLFGVMHWGQLKLLLTEIEFLSTVRAERGSLTNCVVVYAGAAPGHHLPILVEMFPEIDSFELYDPAAFTVPESSKIRIHQQLLELADIDTIRSLEKTFLFVSDIRRDIQSVRLTQGADAVEENIVEDMRLQEAIGRRLGASYMLLKFRLPYVDPRRPRQLEPDIEPDHLSYLAGDILLQPFASTWSTETRLLVRRAADGTYPTRIYNNAVYESQCFHFNCVERRASYAVPLRRKLLSSIPGAVTTNYDILRQVQILAKYIETIIEVQEGETAKQFSERFDEQLRLLVARIHKDLWRLTHRSLITLSLTTALKDRLDTVGEWRKVMSRYNINKESARWAIQEEIARISTNVARQQKFFDEDNNKLAEEQLALLRQTGDEILARYSSAQAAFRNFGRRNG